MCANNSKETAASIKAGISPNLTMETAGSSEMLTHQHKHTASHQNTGQTTGGQHIYIYIYIKYNFTAQYEYQSCKLKNICKQTRHFSELTQAKVKLFLFLIKH